MGLRRKKTAARAPFFFDYHCGPIRSQHFIVEDTPPSNTADYSFNKIANKLQTNNRKIARFFCDFLQLIFTLQKIARKSQLVFTKKYIRRENLRAVLGLTACFTLPM
jgi:hypothetical protein